MSRRTRIRVNRQGSSMGRNHHNNYSSVATHFPQSYSLFGDQINMPSRILPEYQNGRINWVGGECEFLGEDCRLLGLGMNELRVSKSANITIMGDVIQDSNKVLNRCLFVCSLAFVCFLAVFESFVFRKCFFTRYRMKIESYRRLGGILRELVRCQQIILNIQDNELDGQKLGIICQALCQACCGVVRRKVTIRNYCYFMKDYEMEGVLGRLGGMANVESVFIWQGVIVRGGGRGEGENEGLLGSIGG